MSVRNLHANHRLIIIILLSKNKMYGIRANHRKALIFKMIICYIFCARRLSGSGFFIPNNFSPSALALTSTAADAHTVYVHTMGANLGAGAWLLS